MSEYTIPREYQGRSLEDLRSSVRAMEKSIDRKRIDAAIKVGVLPLKPGRRFWVATEINWDDPRLDDMREPFMELVDKHYKLSKIVGRMEAIQSGNLEFWEAKEKANTFAFEHFSTDEEETEFYRKHNIIQGRFGLAIKIVENPKFLEEVEV